MPEKSPLVSVLLPYYQAQVTLPACVRGLQAQTLRDWELVAVDDGSTDGATQWLEAESRNDARLRVMRLPVEPHGGIVKALNAGLEACRGEWLARMDADDLMHPTRLEAQLAFAQSHPLVDLVGSYVWPFSLDETPLSPGVVRYHNWMNRLVTDRQMKAALFVESPMPHPAFFGRTDFFRKLGGYQAPPWPEDYDFLLRAAEAGAVFGKVPKVLVRRSDWPGRLTRVDPVYKREAMFRAKAHYLVRGPWLKHPDGSSRGVVIAGSGPSGRKMAKLLGVAGVPVLAFVDNLAAPPNRTAMGIPAFGFPGEISTEFFQRYRQAFFLGCIGQPDGRGRIVRQLSAEGFAEQQDYLLIL